MFNEEHFLSGQVQNLDLILDDPHELLSGQEERQSGVGGVGGGQEDEGGGEDGPEGLGPRQAGQLGEGGVGLETGDGQQQQLGTARDWQPPDQGQYFCLE